MAEATSRICSAGFHCTGPCNDEEALSPHRHPHAQINDGGVLLGLPRSELVRAQDGDDLFHARLGFQTGELFLAALVTDGPEDDPFGTFTLVDLVAERLDELLDMLDLFCCCAFFHGNYHTVLLYGFLKGRVSHSQGHKRKGRGR